MCSSDLTAPEGGKAPNLTDLCHSKNTVVAYRSTLWGTAHIYIQISIRNRVRRRYLGRLRYSPVSQPPRTQYTALSYSRKPHPSGLLPRSASSASLHPVPYLALNQKHPSQANREPPVDSQRSAVAPCTLAVRMSRRSSVSASASRSECCAPRERGEMLCLPIANVGSVVVGAAV